MLLLTLLMAITSYVSFNFYRAWDFDKPLDLFNHETCKTISDFPGVEDIQMLGDLAIGTTSDFVVLDKESNSKVKKGGLVLIDPKKQSVESLEIKGFPEEVEFHPHGIFIWENLNLYVINHADKNGGERVEVFSILKKPVTITYERSIIFDDSLKGTLNDLVAVGEDKLYITQYFPISIDIGTGQEHGFLAWIQSFFTHYFLSTAGLYYCTNNKGQANCKVMDTAGSFNGISTDGKEIFAVDLARKHIRRYARLPDRTL